MMENECSSITVAEQVDCPQQLQSNEIEKPLGFLACQIEYWNSLYENLMKCCSEFVKNEFTLPPTATEWQFLHILYNNVFYQVQPDTDAMRASRFLPLSAFHPRLCSNHGPKNVAEFSKFDHLLFTSSPVASNWDSLPVQIHPVLYESLLYYQQNWMNQTYVPYLRVWKYDTFPTNNNEQVIEVVAVPITSFEEMQSYWYQHFTFLQDLAYQRRKFLTCKYCFPNVLGVVMHALEKEYDPCYKNIPLAMLMTDGSVFGTTTSGFSINQSNSYFTQLVENKLSPFMSRFHKHFQTSDSLHTLIDKVYHVMDEWGETNYSDVYKKLINQSYHTLQLVLKEQFPDLYNQNKVGFYLVLLRQFEECSLQDPLVYIFPEINVTDSFC